jgi:hypothetical protein
MAKHMSALRNVMPSAQLPKYLIPQERPPKLQFSPFFHGNDFIQECLEAFCSEFLSV